ncbi:ribosome maturation protein SBDS [Histomonas meleagridis]|uniref:ribosome maturation protein SBDS n=1 Tax=Histomonas meleagridis TaxID=135588 RepID=UPI00355A1EED|nr:ribosome maturation protein SBDS [Histomonas meleagridis]KAH0798981.1 ribosome maturation protein SBDS [Histomonas meleagridis]
MALIQPLGQKILSNVSVVKLDRRGQHFEIAVIPNKVTSWRDGLETDIDNVVQSHSIFVNVDRGMLASQAAVFEALKVDDMEEALKIILLEGKVTLAEKERKIRIANLTKDIASIVASQCVNTNTQRPLTSTMIERAMSDIGYSVSLKKAPKAQAMKLIKTLQEKRYPIARARIRIKFLIPPSGAEKMISMLPIVESVEEKDDITVIIAQVDPGSLRPLAEDLVKEFGKNVGIAILELNVSPATMENLEDKVNTTNEKKNEGTDSKGDKTETDTPENKNEM